MWNKSILFILLSFVCSVKLSRILCIFPIPSISHQVVFRAYTQDLIARGHELVIITPNPFYEEGKAPKNVIEINTNYTYPLLHEQLKNQETIRGVVFPSSQITYKNFEVYIRINILTFQNKVLRRIIKDKNEKFDLIVAEAVSKLPIYLKKIFDCPFLSFSSFYGDLSLYDGLGAPAWHPIIYPNFLQNRIYDLTIFEKIRELYTFIMIFPEFIKLAELEQKAFKELYGETDIDYEDLLKHVDMVFLNANPMFVANRPIPPNMLFLGGMHLQPVKEIPKDLKSYLDSSKRGVVYVSLGTNVFPEKMTPDLLEAFLGAFAALPYDVLWKFNGELKNKSDNLRTEKWFPQRDMLFHPNIKVFVTQGGLQSIDEAIDAEVPVVGIPMLADQWFNVEQCVRLGFGVQVNALTMTAKDLEDAINEVINNDTYRQNIVRVRYQMNDQPKSPMEQAEFWTEYVIRNRGALHLRNYQSMMTWPEYYGFLVLVFLIFMLIVSLVLGFLYWLGCKVIHKKKGNKTLKTN